MSGIAATNSVLNQKMRKRKLKIWNGRGAGQKYRNGHLFVAAYSVKQAAELINKGCDTYITAYEIKHYFNPDCWGDTMKGIEPTEPCLYGTTSDKLFENPIKII
jgi:hypothetical protein